MFLKCIPYEDIDNNLKGHYIDKPSNLNQAYISVF